MKKHWKLVVAAYLAVGFFVAAGAGLSGKSSKLAQKLGGKNEVVRLLVAILTWPLILIGL